MRRIATEVLSRKAIAYSGYREGQSPDKAVYPSADQIRWDLELLVRHGFGWIRLYDVSTHGQRTVKLIHDAGLDIKVLLGIWIYGPAATHDVQNQEQIAKGIELANAYSEIVAAVSVGNETMVDWSFIAVPPLDMRNYIRQVQARISQPVGTDDNYEPFTFVDELGRPYPAADALLEVARTVDFLALHTYPLADPFYCDPQGVSTWDWRQEAVPPGPARAVAMMAAAFSYARKNIQAVQGALQAAGLRVPILIGETGWTDTGKFGGNGAHPVNQAMFYDSMSRWIYGSGKDADSPLALFYFEAFDEPWKGDDDNWGLFFVDRTPKYVIHREKLSLVDAFWYGKMPSTPP